MSTDPFWTKSQLDVPFMALGVLLSGIISQVGTLYPPLHHEYILISFIRIHILGRFYRSKFLY